MRLEIDLARLVLGEQSRLAQHGIRIPEPAVAFDAVVGADDQRRVGHQAPNRRDVVVRAAAEHLLVDRPDSRRQRRVVAGCVGVQHADERVSRDVHVRNVRHQQIPGLACGIADRAIEVLLVGGGRGDQVAFGGAVTALDDWFAKLSGRVEARAGLADGDPGFGEQGIACLRFGRDEPDDVAELEQDSTGRRVVLEQADAKLARGAVHRDGQRRREPAGAGGEPDTRISESQEHAAARSTIDAPGRVANGEGQGRSAERASHDPTVEQLVGVDVELQQAIRVEARERVSVGRLDHDRPLAMPGRGFPDRLGAEDGAQVARLPLEQRVLARRRHRHPVVRGAVRPRKRARPERRMRDGCQRRDDRDHRIGASAFACHPRQRRRLPLGNQAVDDPVRTGVERQQDHAPPARRLRRDVGPRI